MAILLKTCLELAHLKLTVLTCGTHLGDTKLVTSMWLRPLSDNRSIRPILTVVVTMA